MVSFNSTLFDLALNALFNENQAQDENCCNTETQTIIIQALEEEFANLKTSSQQEKARLEAQIKEAEIENKGKELKILELEELVTTLRQTIFYLEKSSQQEKARLEAQIKEAEKENKGKEELVTSLRQTISYLEKSSQQEKMLLEAQIREKDLKMKDHNIECQSTIRNLESRVQKAQNKNAMKATKITQLETKVRHISFELEVRDRMLEDVTDRFVRLGLDLDASQQRENELSETVSHLGTEIENAQRENCDLRRRLTTCEETCSSLKHVLDLSLEDINTYDEELSALECREQEHLKTISDLKERSLQEKTQLQKDAEMESDRQKSKIKELEELLTNGQSREREYLKKNSDLETNSQNEKTRLMAQIQEMENAMINARVPLESSVDDIIDVKVEEKEIIPSKSRDNGKNTDEKCKKGLLIGGGCLAAAVALWKYGPDVSGLASALNQPRLTGNLL